MRKKKLKRLLTWQVIHINANNIVVSAATNNVDHDTVINASDQYYVPEIENWIVDYGATSHMTYKIDTLDNVTHKNIGRKVFLRNGQTTLVTHSGSYEIPDCSTLKNILVIPDFKHDLLSTSQLIRQL